MPADEILYGKMPTLRHPRRVRSDDCPPPRVAEIGDTVTLLNRETRKEQRIALSRTAEHLGPAAKAVLGKSIGTVVDIPLTKGTVPHQILKIETTD